MDFFYLHDYLKFYVNNVLIKQKRKYIIINYIRFEKKIN
jgi:hypothetical protein